MRRANSSFRSSYTSSLPSGERLVVVVSQLKIHDVLLGRGTGPNEHQGNRVFREQIRLLKDDYAATRLHRNKNEIIHEVIETVHGKGGRFLKKLQRGLLNGVQGTGDLYEVADQDTVIEKVRQCFQYSRRGNRGASTLSDSTATAEETQHESIAFASVEGTMTLANAAKQVSSSRTTAKQVSSSRTTSSSAKSSSPSPPSPIQHQAASHAALGSLLTTADETNLARQLRGGTMGAGAYSGGNFLAAYSQNNHAGHHDVQSLPPGLHTASLMEPDALRLALLGAPAARGHQAARHASSHASSQGANHHTALGSLFATAAATNVAHLLGGGTSSAASGANFHPDLSQSSPIINGANPMSLPPHGFHNGYHNAASSLMMESELLRLVLLGGGGAAAAAAPATFSPGVPPAIDPYLLALLSTTISNNPSPASWNLDPRSNFLLSAPTVQQQTAASFSFAARQQATDSALLLRAALLNGDRAALLNGDRAALLNGDRVGHQRPSTSNEVPEDPAGEGGNQRKSSK
jgi:hypothetical protein